MKIFLILMLIAISTTSASGQGKTLQEITITQAIEGITVSFPVSVTVTKVDGDQALVATASVYLTDLISKVDQIINAVWIKQKIDLDDRLRHNGTLLSVENASLRAKVHFNVRPGGLPSSNGSVVAYFQPVVADGRIGLTATVAEFNISNDVTRLAAEALNIDDLLRDKLGNLLSTALSAPEAGLALPPAVQALGVTLKTARFGVIDGKPSLIIDGSLPAAAALLLNL